MYILLLQDSQCNPVKIAFAAAVVQILSAGNGSQNVVPLHRFSGRGDSKLGPCNPAMTVYILPPKQCRCEICCDDCVNTAKGENSICTDGPQCDPPAPLYRSSRHPNRTSRAPVVTFCPHLLCRTSPIAPLQLNSSRPQNCNPRNDQDSFLGNGYSVVVGMPNSSARSSKGVFSWSLLKGTLDCFLSVAF